MVNFGGLGGLVGGFAGGATVSIVVNAVDQFSGTFTRLGQKLNSLQRMSTGFTSVLGGAVTAITGLGVAAGGFAVKEAISLESAMAGVAKTTDLTAEELKALEDQFQEISGTVPTSAQELAKFAELGGQLGIEKENLADFSRLVADMGNTTNLAGEEAALSLARLAEITSLPQNEMEKLGSTIVDLGNNLATTETEITEMGLRLSGAGTTIGLTQDQILGFGAALSSVGVNAEAGGTAMSRVFIEIANAVAEGEEKLDEFATLAGISSEEFAAAFESDPATAITSFINGLSKVEDAGGNVFESLEKVGLGEIRVRDALLRLASSGTVLDESLGIASKAWEENTALATEAEKRYATTESQMTAFGNRVKNSMADMGQEIQERLGPTMEKLGVIFEEKILPALQFLVDALVSFIEKMDEIGAIDFLGNVIEGLLTFTALVIRGIQTVIEFVDVLWEWGKVLWPQVMASVQRGFERLKAGINLVKLSFQAMGVTAQLVWEGIKLAGAKMVNSVVKFFADMVNDVVNILNRLITQANRIPGVNIPLLSRVDTSSLLINTADIESRIGELTQRGQEISREIVVNIETLSGLDVDEIADALKTKLNDLVDTA